MATMMRKPQACVFAATMVVGGCAVLFLRTRHAPTPRIYVWEETMWAAENAGFDYVGNLARAEQGNDDALKNLILFSHKTDAASSLGHGTVLYQLLEKLGDKRFANAIYAARAVDSRPLGDLLAAGVDYSSDEGRWHDAAEIDAFLRETYPLSYAAQNAEVKP